MYTDIFDTGQNTIANKQENRLDYRVTKWIYNLCFYITILSLSIIYVHKMLKTLNILTINNIILFKPLSSIKL